jgi:hypothetical protein
VVVGIIRRFLNLSNASGAGAAGEAAERSSPLHTRKAGVLLNRARPPKPYARLRENEVLAAELTLRRPLPGAFPGASRFADA